MLQRTAGTEDRHDLAPTPIALGRAPVPLGDPGFGGRDLGAEMSPAVLDDRAVEQFDLVEPAAYHVGEDYTGFSVELCEVAQVRCVLLSQRGAKLLEQVAVHDVIDVHGINLAGDRIRLTFELLVFWNHLERSELLAQPHRTGLRDGEMRPEIGGLTKVAAEVAASGRLAELLGDLLLTAQFLKFAGNRPVET